jgi:ribosomal protein S17
MENMELVAFCCRRDSGMKDFMETCLLCAFTGFRAHRRVRCHAMNMYIVSGANSKLISVRGNRKSFAKKYKTSGCAIKRITIRDLDHKTGDVHTNNIIVPSRKHWPL